MYWYYLCGDSKLFALCVSLSCVISEHVWFVGLRCVFPSPADNWCKYKPVDKDNGSVCGAAVSLYKRYANYVVRYRTGSALLINCELIYENMCTHTLG